MNSTNYRIHFLLLFSKTYLESYFKKKKGKGIRLYRKDYTSFTLFFKVTIFVENFAEYTIKVLQRNNEFQIFYFFFH